jgi:hypothetical protein
MRLAYLAEQVQQNDNRYNTQRREYEIVGTTQGKVDGIIGSARSCADDSAGSDVVSPAENQCNWTAEKSRHPDPLQAGVRQAKGLEGKISYLQYDPAANNVNSGNSEYTASPEFSQELLDPEH